MTDAVEDALSRLGANIYDPECAAAVQIRTIREHYAALLLQVAEMSERLEAVELSWHHELERRQSAERAREEANKTWREAFVGVVQAALTHDGMGHLEASVKANAQADRIAAFLAANGGK